MELKLNEGIKEIANQAVAGYEYVTGKRTHRFTNLVDADDSEIRQVPEMNDLVKSFKDSGSDVNVQVDDKGRHFVVKFSATKVPSDLVNEFKENGKYFKNINNYDKESKEVEMVFNLPESVMAPTPTPYDKRVKKSRTEGKNPFKDKHICQGCGKPLSQCTCKISEESFEEDLSESFKCTGFYEGSSDEEFGVKYIGKGGKKSVFTIGRFTPDCEERAREFLRDPQFEMDDSIYNEIVSLYGLDDYGFKFRESLREDYGMDLPSNSTDVETYCKEHQNDILNRFGYIKDVAESLEFRWRQKLDGHFKVALSNSVHDLDNFIKMAEELRDSLTQVNGKIESISGAPTQSSNIGQHKSCALDLKIPEEEGM